MNDFSPESGSLLTALTALPADSCAPLRTRTFESLAPFLPRIGGIDINTFKPATVGSILLQLAGGTDNNARFATYVLAAIVPVLPFAQQAQVVRLVAELPRTDLQSWEMTLLVASSLPNQQIGYLASWAMAEESAELPPDHRARALAIWCRCAPEPLCTPGHIAQALLAVAAISNTYWRYLGLSDLAAVAVGEQREAVIGYAPTLDEVRAIPVPVEHQITVLLGLAEWRPADRSALLGEAIRLLPQLHPDLLYEMVQTLRANCGNNRDDLAYLAATLQSLEEQRGRGPLVLPL